MWHDLNKAVLKKQPKWLFFPAGDQGASSAATKSCHGDKFRLTTPLTTYGKSVLEICFSEMLMLEKKNFSLPTAYQILRGDHSPLKLSKMMIYLNSFFEDVFYYFIISSKAHKIA